MSIVWFFTRVMVKIITYFIWLNVKIPLKQLGVSYFLSYRLILFPFNFHFQCWKSTISSLFICFFVFKYSSIWLKELYQQWTAPLVSSLNYNPGFQIINYTSLLFFIIQALTGRALYYLALNCNKEYWKPILILRERRNMSLLSYNRRSFLIFIWWLRITN
jgi:hypothetical protein